MSDRSGYINEVTDLLKGVLIMCWYEVINGVKVNKLKADHVRVLLDAVKNTKGFTGLLLFGSVIREDCTEESDIDCVILGTARDDKIFLRYDRLIKTLAEHDINQEYDLFYQQVGKKGYGFAKEGKILWQQQMVS